MIDDAAYLELLGFVEDELTTVEQEQLIRRLQASPELADELLRVAADEVRLTSLSRSTRDAATSLRPADGRLTFAPLRRVSVAGMALAATLLLLIGAAVVYMASESASPPPSAAGEQVASSSQRSAPSNSTTAIARVDDASRDAEWFIENLIHRENRQITPGDTLRVNRGQVDVRFVHGTLVTLRAPAILEIQDSMSTRVHRGSIRVDVAKGAEGFQVATPLARVIDLGTKFGVDVDDQGRTDVAVFEGAVDVQGGVDEQAHLPKLQRLNAGEAVSLDSLGTVSRIVTIAGDRFPYSGGPRPPHLDRPLLISQVRDNIERDASYKFYEIVRAGMSEDAKAFVDRPYHEWNGLTPAGLPAYLAQGDYVKTFNSDKMNPQIQIQLTLAQPAIVYLLLDNRVPIPRWLAELFEDTGDDIGLDEGYDVSPTNQKNAAGAGQSVDNTFSIWRRVVSRPGVLKLGAIEKLAPGPNPSWINMYGVVAVPLSLEL